MAMDKQMRIYCARLLTQIKSLDDKIVAQMMAKEEITSNQKFMSVTGGKKNKVSTVEAEVIQACPVTRGILLMLLEDDSMAVRLAGIRAMSLMAVNCAAIRSQVLRLLIDMLNDEIDAVRIAALHGISRFNR